MFGLYENYLNLTRMITLRLFKMAPKLRLEQRSVMKFLLAESANHVKFTGECVMYTEKHVSVKKKKKKIKITSSICVK